MINLAKIIADKFDKKIEIDSLNKKEAVGNLYRKYYMPDISILKKEFGFIEKIILMNQ